MKSDKWKAIIIKDAQLRKIRKNLRVLLKSAIDIEISRLRGLENLYRKKRISSNLTPSQWKREITLSRMSNRLDQARYRSILQCTFGSMCISPEAKRMHSGIASLNKDMVWSPLEKAWICIDCYNYYYGTEAKRQWFKQHLEKEAALWDEITKDLPKNLSEREVSEVVDSLKKNGII